MVSRIQQSHTDPTSQAEASVRGTPSPLGVLFPLWKLCYSVLFRLRKLFRRDNGIAHGNTCVMYSIALDGMVERLLVVTVSVIRGEIDG